MQTIWAPWRIKYILGEKETGCFLCNKSKQHTDDHGNFVLCRGEHAFVLMNIYPYNNGHLMIAPHAHVSSLTDLHSTQLIELFSLTQLCERILTQAIRPEGFNIGMNLGKAAGAGVEDHLHIHVVPRWNGDTNYMTAVSNTRVIPQHLEELHQILHPFFVKHQHTA